MVKICLFEDQDEIDFRPLTLTKPTFFLRTGCFTQIERVRRLFPKADLVVDCRTDLHPLMKEKGIAVRSAPSPSEKILFLNARWMGNRGDIYNKIKDISQNTDTFTFVQDEILLVAFQNADFDPIAFKADADSSQVSSEYVIKGLGSLVSDVGGQIAADIRFFDHNAENLSSESSPGIHLVNPKEIWCHGSNIIEPNCVLDASKGPILIEDGVTIKASSVLYGPLFLGKNATVNALTRLSAVSLGPWCKIGGEVSQSVFQGYSNKGHDGYVGNSYISEWCNLGADTNTSNLRNDYSPVKLFSARTSRDESTGLTFAGLIMADHSKCSINTMFNTGTVVGVSCNLFGPGFHDRHIPSFTWGKPGKYLPYRIDKALGVAERMMARRDRELENSERNLLQEISHFREKKKA